MVNFESQINLDIFGNKSEYLEKTQREKMKSLLPQIRILTTTLFILLYLNILSYYLGIVLIWLEMFITGMGKDVTKGYIPGEVHLLYLLHMHLGVFILFFIYLPQLLCKSWCTLCTGFNFITRPDKVMYFKQF